MLVAIFQWIGSSVVWLFLFVFARVEIIGRDNLGKANKPVIVVANHKSFLDPPLVGVTMLYRSKLLPIRFMTKDDFFWIPGFNILIILLGSFAARRKTGIENSLRTPLRILKNKGTVMVFPEGGRFHDRTKLNVGRRGASMLAIMSQVEILPLSLHVPPALTPWNILTTQPKILIRVGQTFRLDKADFPDVTDETVKKGTELIMQKISELYFH